MAKPTIFISYSHKDEQEKAALVAHLGVLANQGLVDVWVDDRIGAGGNWQQEIAQAIAQAKVAILLITANFLTSDFILNQEVPELLKRRQDEGLVVFPVIARACAWDTADWLTQMNVRPKNGTPIWSGNPGKIDEELTAIAREVAAIVKEAQAKQARLFICYKRHAETDQRLALYLHQTLTAQGHEVFIDQTMRTGVTWLEEIDRQIKSSDFLITLLSKDSADSEMVQAEVRRAYEYRNQQGKPNTLPVRINYEGLLPYSISALLSSLQYVSWQSDADNERVAQEILMAVQGQSTQPEPEPSSMPRLELISEDGRPVGDDDEFHPPLPEFDPRFLEAPGGAVKMRDKLYIERDADAHLKREIVNWGTTTTIRASRQTGKTSLLMRGIRHARQSGAKVVPLDFQGFGHDQLASPDIFLRELAETICHELRLDTSEVDKAWKGSLGAQKKLSYFIEDYVLPAFDAPIVLAMDEADSLLQTPFYQDFFGMVRSWHNRRALYEDWERLNIVLVISTEPYLLIEDVSQSPFNVGLKLELKDFTETQVKNLNHRHGAPVAEQDIPKFMALLNGHPYLTRKALYTMIKGPITWPNFTQIAASDQGPFGDHLRRHHWHLRDKPELREALKQVVHAKRCSDEMALFRLLRAGLIKGRGNVFMCRCDLYRQYFEDKL